MNLNLHLHIRIALIYFLIVAVLGAILRLFVLVDIPATYRFLVHTHSHVALLGWVYIAITTLLYRLFLYKAGVEKVYKRIFLFTQITILGMLCSFPFQGYALFSIFFSSLFLISNYFFAWLFLTKTPAEKKRLFSYKLVKASVFFMVFSSLSLWMMGYIMTVLGSTSIWYSLAIYFYLHFQYNGWFVLSLSGVLLYIAEKNGLLLSLSEKQKIYFPLVISVLLTFFLSVLWLEPPVVFYLLAGVGVLLQLYAFGVFGKKIVFFHWSVEKSVLRLLQIAGILFLVKLVMQSLSIIPYIAMTAYHNLDFIIGYLHLIFLGVVSVAIFAFLRHFKLIRFSKAAFALYFSAFILTETLLFYKGVVLWFKIPLWEEYYLFLAVASLLFSISITWFLLINMKNKKL